MSKAPFGMIIYELDIDNLLVILQERLLGMFLILRRGDGEDPRELISG